MLAKVKRMFWTQLGDTCVSLTTVVQYILVSGGDKIQVSPETKLFLDMSGGFRCEDRGFIDIKGKGSLQTFYVLSKVN